MFPHTLSLRRQVTGHTLVPPPQTSVHMSLYNIYRKFRTKIIFSGWEKVIILDNHGSASLLNSTITKKGRYQTFSWSKCLIKRPQANSKNKSILLTLWLSPCAASGWSGSSCTWGRTRRRRGGRAVRTPRDRASGTRCPARSGRTGWSWSCCCPLWSDPGYAASPEGREHTTLPLMFSNSMIGIYQGYEAARTRSSDARAWAFLKSSRS